MALRDFVWRQDLLWVRMASQNEVTVVLQQKIAAVSRRKRVTVGFVEVGPTVVNYPHCHVSIWMFG